MSKTAGASNAPTTNEPDKGRLDEAARVRLIAKKHGLRPDGLAELISESRAQARRSRRRLSDVRLDDLVRDIGVRTGGAPSSRAASGGAARKTGGSR